MLTLPAAVEAERVKTANAPITQVVITFPDAYVARLSNVAHIYDGDAYSADLLGDVQIDWGLTGKFDNANFSVANMDRAWTDLLNTYEAPEIQQATVDIYETFLGLTARQQIFSGFLDLPKDVNRSRLNLTSTMVINNLAEQFNDLVFAPGCEWARKGLFANATVGHCPYDAGATYGQASTLAEDIAIDETAWDVADGSLYIAGGYVQVDDEIVYVSDVTSNTLTVTRAQRGTTAATHASGATVAHQSCNGSYDNCLARGMAYRFGGLKFFPREGSYYYKQKMFWFISQKIEKTWKSQGNQGIFGTPWGVAYGTVKVNAVPLYVRDPGGVAVFFASLGCGRIGGKVDPPSYYQPFPPPAGNSPVIINGRPFGSAHVINGSDGVDDMNEYGEDIQGFHWIWMNDPTTNPTVESNETNSQTFSRMAYVWGAFPSDVQTEEGFPDVEVYMTGRYPRHYDSGGNYTGDFFTANPAWIFVDMLINQDYGAGLAESVIDFASVAAAYNDFEAEGITFNAFLDGQMPLADAISLLCNSTRSYPTYSNGKIGLKVIRSSQAATALSFDASDYVKGSCRYWVDGPHSRDTNTLTIEMQDADYGYQNVPVTFTDQDHVASCGGKKKKLSLNIAGITNLDQAIAVGAWHMNLAKISRRQDGALKLTLCGSLGMSIQPGDIITVDATPVNGFAATQYLVWNVRRAGNNGNRELSLVKWDTGLFDLYGVDYTTPFTAINPSLDPVPVENLAATVTDIGDGLVQLRVTWTWPAAAPPKPEPAWVYLFAGNSAESLHKFDLLTPAGVKRPTTEYVRTLPRAYQELRVFAVAKSAFYRPQNPKPEYAPDGDLTTTTTEALDATEYVISVDDASALSVTAGDFICFEYIGQLEILKVSDVDANDITVESYNSDRVGYFDSTPQVWTTGANVYKLKFNAPYVDVIVVGSVQEIPYVRAYDYLTDTTLASNQLRVKIPRDDTLGDMPKVLHLQLNDEQPFPEPVASPEGAGDAVLERSFGDTILVPTAYDMSSATDLLFVLFDPDGEKMGRYIESIEDGVSWSGETWKRVHLNGYIPRMAGTYDWAVWSKWYESADYHTNITLTPAHLNLTDNVFDVTVTIDLNFTGYLRAYLLTDASISDGVIATDVGTEADTVLHLVTTTDSAVPSVPTNVSADHNGRTITVRWDAPASNTATLIRYLVRVSLTDYTDDGDSTYSMTGYLETEVPAGVTAASIPVTAAGRYSIGVLAENAVGLSDYGIYWVEA